MLPRVRGSSRVLVKHLLVITLLVGSAPAAAQPAPAPPPLPADIQRLSLTIAVADLPSFVAKPEHKYLRWVTVDGCGTIPDLAPLKSLPSGVELQLGKSNCLTIERLDGVERVGSLSVFGVVRDASALARATPLRRLSLHNGPLPIADLVALPPDLEALDVNLQKSSRGEIRQLFASPLVRGLDSLSISVSEVPALPRLPKLTKLYVSMFPADTSYADLGFLRNTPAVKHLGIGGVEDANLEPIIALRRLETLDVAGLCRIDARPLARMPTLTRVTIARSVDEANKPVRAGLDVHRSNPYALCSAPPNP